MNCSHNIGVVVLIFPLSLCYPINGRQETYSGVTDERLSCLAILHIHRYTSSETQGQSVGSGGKEQRSF